MARWKWLTAASKKAYIEGGIHASQFIKLFLWNPEALCDP
jgi:hypothetical protein